MYSFSGKLWLRAFFIGNGTRDARIFWGGGGVDVIVIPVKCWCVGDFMLRDSTVSDV